MTATPPCVARFLQDAKSLPPSEYLTGKMGTFLEKFISVVRELPADPPNTTSQDQFKPPYDQLEAILRSMCE